MAISIWTLLVPLGVSGLVSGATVVAGYFLKAAIEKGIQSRLDTALEAVRSGYRREEEALKAALKARDEQIAALRAGALQGLAARQLELDKRRIEASGKLWEAVSFYGRLKLAAEFAGRIKFDAVAAERGGPDGHKVQKFLDELVKAASLTNFPKGPLDTDAQRPFLSPYTWALFDSYRAALLTPAMMLLAAQAKGDVSIIDTSRMITLLKEAMPEQAEFLDKHPDSTFLLIDQLENKLLTSLQDELAGKAVDEDHLARAAKIMSASSDLAASWQRVEISDVAEVLR